MKMRKGWKKKTRMRRRRWTTEWDGKTGTLEGTTLKYVIHVYVKLLLAGQSSLRWEYLRRWK